MSKDIHTDPTRRHDFVLLFDVENGNPNGDPDAGNLPRIDPETMHGIITDVCLKRKVRDYLQMTENMPIFIQSETALNRLISDAAKEVGVEPPQCTLEDEQIIEWFQSDTLENFDLDNNTLTYTGESRKKAQIRKAFAGVEDRDLKTKLNKVADDLAESVKKDTLTNEDRMKTQKAMIKKYYDIRMFGAVLSTGLNAGQVRGPVQFTFARSVDPIFRLDNAITRKAVTKEEDKKRKETEMARKPIIPYALYVAHGFYNPYFALEPKTEKDDQNKYKVSEEDLSNLWESLEWMFNNDTAAARGKMATRGLYVFSHDNMRGNAPSHKLFRRIKVEKNDDKKKKGDPARNFYDYKVIIDESKLKELSINLEKLVHEEEDNEVTPNDQSK
ncbi:MAG: type I-C CRISPR-associated protein Cas7/Csd2 [Candidatus Scalinduaceae bacterium]